MRRRYLGSFLLGLLSTEADAFANLHIFEQLRYVPEGWEQLSAPDPRQLLRLQVALSPQNVERFEQTVLNISKPDNVRYGQHMSREEVEFMLKPADESRTAVWNWLTAAGIPGGNITDKGDWLQVTTPVQTVESALNNTFFWYRELSSGQRRIRALQYSVPEDVRAHINVIQPTTRFGQMSPQRLDSVFCLPKAALQDISLHTQTPGMNRTFCNGTTTPKCLKQMYNIHYRAPANTANKIGFASFLNESARYSDLALFEEKLAPTALGQTLSVVSTNGALDDQSPGGSTEANLDSQYLVGVASGVPVTEYITSGLSTLVPEYAHPSLRGSNEPYLDFLQHLLKLPNEELPQVISVSYGEDEQTVPESFARQTCFMIAQLGARGTSVIFASGDKGVGTACMKNDGSNTTHFPPQFPAACPWVTSVGGVRYIDPEQAVYFSSGGFSDLWPRPEYQDEAVEAYLQNQLGDRQKGLFDPRGRAFPDVAAQSVRYIIADAGDLYYEDGTSCAAPTFAAVIGLLNAARISSQLPPLGFLNPWLYSVGKLGLNDIVHGGSTGCDGHFRFDGDANGSPVVPYASWNATVGWDPVTGLGTPDFGKLLELSTPWVANTGGGD